MATPPCFDVLTSSDVEARMVINYLLKTTGLWLVRVYYDTLADRSTKRRSQKGTDCAEPSLTMAEIPLASSTFPSPPTPLRLESSREGDWPLPMEPSPILRKDQPLSLS